MIINISYLNTPLEYDDLKLNENMWITAKPYYKNKNIKFEKLHRMVSSDYRQYSPFLFKDGIETFGISTGAFIPLPTTQLQR